MTIRTAYLVEIDPIDPNYCLDPLNTKLTRWKLALSRDDDKRITLDGIASLARGHYKVWGL